MQQPMLNPEDISDPTTALDMALKFMSKAFQLNNITPTNNNQRSLSTLATVRLLSQFRENTVQNVGHLVGQNAIQNQGTQNVRNQNGLSVVLEIANQHGNGNVVAARAEVKLRKQDVAYLQKQMQIAQKEEAGIQLTFGELDFMATAGAYEETEK
ncbi:hypothetical protein Tco_0931345, partial [Tanacetum coccineum]